VKGGSPHLLRTSLVVGGPGSGFAVLFQRVRIVDNALSRVPGSEVALAKTIVELEALDYPIDGLLPSSLAIVDHLIDDAGIDIQVTVVPSPIAIEVDLDDIIRGEVLSNILRQFSNLEVTLPSGLLDIGIGLWKPGCFDRERVRPSRDFPRIVWIVGPTAKPVLRIARGNIPPRILLLVIGSNLVVRDDASSGGIRNLHKCNRSHFPHDTVINPLRQTSLVHPLSVHGVVDPAADPKNGLPHPPVFDVNPNWHQYVGHEKRTYGARNTDGVLDTT